MMNNDLISRKALVAALIKEREHYPPMVAERYSFGVKLPHHFNQAMRGGIRKALRLVETAVPAVNGDTSDGYHTFNELYHHRAVLFSVIVKAFPEKAWKSRQHSDGSMYDGMFIVGIDTPNGQATYHYDLDPYWDMFQCKELECAPEWNGYTAADAIERIGKLEPVRHGRYGFVGPHIGSTCSPYAEHGTCIECKERILIDPHHKNYCPNCGAKMDLEVQDD